MTLAGLPASVTSFIVVSGLGVESLTGLTMLCSVFELRLDVQGREDVSVGDHGALGRGARLVLHPDDERHDRNGHADNGEGNVQ
jgi:hypothetical protein